MIEGALPTCLTRKTTHYEVIVALFFDTVRNIIEYLEAIHLRLHVSLDEDTALADTVGDSFELRASQSGDDLLGILRGKTWHGGWPECTGG